jgi:hypothetical protein
VSAQLRLRSGAAQLVWPAGEATGAIVLLGDAPESLCRSLADALGAVVLSVAAADGEAALEWAADHAAELGADGARLILAGARDEAAAVAQLAARARAHGWPAVACELLIEQLSGQAIATGGCSSARRRGQPATPSRPLGARSSSCQVPFSTSVPRS